jgi:hypothetical protein
MKDSFYHLKEDQPRNIFCLPKMEKEKQRARLGIWPLSFGLVGLLLNLSFLWMNDFHPSYIAIATIPLLLTLVSIGLGLKLMFRHPEYIEYKPN